MAAGTNDDPWMLKTPPGSSEYSMYRDNDNDPPALVCQVGSTTLTYHLQAVEDLHAWLVEQGGWVPLGAADEKKPAADGTVEAWGRSADNPVGGWYGLRKGYRGRFGMYLPALLEELGLAELTHDARNNRIRAIPANGTDTMSKATVVRYTTRPEAAEENERLIAAVFAQLADERPDGMRYVVIRLEDGSSFVHVALFEGEDNPLPALGAFGEFVTAIDTRCAERPTATNGTVIGNF